MLSFAGTTESSMSKAGLDNRHRNHDGEIGHKHGNTLVGTLRKTLRTKFCRRLSRDRETERDSFSPE
jgi:hypothetical protein